MKILYLIAIPFLLLFSCKSSELVVSNEEVNLEPKSKGEIIYHSLYSLAYSENDEQAYWVYYRLTPEMINGEQSRTDDFREDPLVSTGSATLSDYKGSGYDRGHLCPAADMKLNKTSMSESFYLSNMSPQEPSFNRGIWAKLEAQVRTWVLEHGDLYVATGGILNENKGAIGEGEVSIPKYYYKVLYSEQNGMIAFILPNEGSKKTLGEFAVTVDSVEVATGIDFFSDMENEMENVVSLSRWGF